MPENDPTPVPDPTGGDPTGADPTGGDPTGGDPSEWTAPTSQAELDKIIERRLRQERNRYRDYDSLKAKAGQYDALAAASQTDQERAAAEAQEAGYNAAMAKLVPQMVRAEFRATATGRLSGEQLETLLEDVDLTRFVDDDGKPDVDKIKRKVDALAPKQAPPSFGQGPRGQAPRQQSVDSFIRRAAGVLPAS